MRGRRIAGRLLMLISGLLMAVALLLLFRPQSLSGIISPPGEEYRPNYVHGQIRVFGYEPVNLTPEETAALLSILDEEKVIFWGFQQTEPILNASGTPQLYELYFSRDAIAKTSSFTCAGHLTYLAHRGCFWSGEHLYRLLGKESREAFSQLLQTHRPTIAQP